MAVAVTASVFSGNGGRSYLVAANEDAWTRLVSQTGSAQLGFAQTNEFVSHVQVTYSAGSCVFRIRNSVSQVTKTVGMGFLLGASGPAPYSGEIPPLVLAQDDVLEVYVAAVA
jgi:hypothetical protein